MSLRLPESDLAVIDRAAGLRGCSRTQFMREASVMAAEQLILEQTLISLTPEGFAGFMAALSAPAVVVPELAALRSHPAPWDTKP
jgi:uncharacterized protein (DUF1778 family)